MKLSLLTVGQRVFLGFSFLSMIAALALSFANYRQALARHDSRASTVAPRSVIEEKAAPLEFAVNQHALSSESVQR